MFSLFLRVLTDHTAVSLLLRVSQGPHSCFSSPQSFSRTTQLFLFSLEFLTDHTAISLLLRVSHGPHSCVSSLQSFSRTSHSVFSFPRSSYGPQTVALLLRVTRGPHKVSILLKVSYRPQQFLFSSEFLWTTNSCSSPQSLSWTSQGFYSPQSFLPITTVSFLLRVLMNHKQLLFSSEFLADLTRFLFSKKFSSTTKVSLLLRVIMDNTQSIVSLSIYQGSDRVPFVIKNFLAVFESPSLSYYAIFLITPLSPGYP